MVDNVYNNFIIQLSSSKIIDRAVFFNLQRQFAKKSKKSFLEKDRLIKAYHNLVHDGIIPKNDVLLNLIRMKSTRSLSGIVVVSVLTKPYPCPGQCIYCPTQKNIPKSYLKNEPAVARAIMCRFDPYVQTQARLFALSATGHITDKVSVRVIGGTWSYYPLRYRSWFIKRVFDGCNDFKGRKPSSVGLMAAQIKNQSAPTRIVEVSIETRQDFINDKEILHLRKLGVTKVELGVQSIYDKILSLNKRGNTDNDTVNATKLLKDAGFKVSYQMMANLPGSNVKTDKQMFAEIFTNSKYRPDHIKIYPLALVKESKLFESYANNKFKPYNKNQLINVLKSAKRSIPFFCRVERVIRDIPASDIVAGGAKISNLRQEAILSLKKDGDFCRCVRCREIKSRFNKNDKFRLFREDYDASGGREIFLSFENDDRSKLVGLLRLRIPSNIFYKQKHQISTLDNSAIIREIHVYGPQVEIGKTDSLAVQHKGFGKKLITEAEKIVLSEFGLTKIAIISGVGVREYFKYFGYCLKNTYMIKQLVEC